MSMLSVIKSQVVQTPDDVTSFTPCMLSMCLVFYGMDCSTTLDAIGHTSQVYGFC